MATGIRGVRRSRRLENLRARGLLIAGGDACQRRSRRWYSSFFGWAREELSGAGGAMMVYRLPGTERAINPSRWRAGLAVTSTGVWWTWILGLVWMRVNIAPVLSGVASSRWRGRGRLEFSVVFNRLLVMQQLGRSKCNYVRDSWWFWVGFGEYEYYGICLNSNCFQQLLLRADVDVE